MNWIKASDQLPDNGREVLIFDYESAHFAIGAYVPHLKIWTFPFRDKSKADPIIFQWTDIKNELLVYVSYSSLSGDNNEVD